MLFQHCSYLLDGRRILMLEDLVSDDPEEHVTGDVQTQSEKGQCHEREKYEGCN